jgi:indolepyruvate ferredoxin oxidoreductase beta subunit
MNTHSIPLRPISLLICALGGEGGGVLSEWLMEVARLSGYVAQSTSIPGVAQRTGATTYYVEVFPQPLSELGVQRPILSLYPAPGLLDAMISSELLETARQISLGMSSPQRTHIITSSARSLTTLERMQPADGRVDPAVLLDLVRAHSSAHHVLNMSALAQQAGTIVSAVMLGALAGSGLLPFERSVYETVLNHSGPSGPASLRGFELGWQQIQQPQSPHSHDPTAPPSEVEEFGAGGLTQDNQTWMNLWLEPFPQPAQDLIRLGISRLLDYQDRAYAKLYIERLQIVLLAEQTADPGHQHQWATTRETARWLALWMAYDDVIRVADLKSRKSRFERVRREVKAGPQDLLRVYDHFKPGLPELAGLLPQLLAKPLLAVHRRRELAGKTPWALPLKISTHALGGLLALRALAAFKHLRRWGSRHASEQALIQEWLQTTIRLSRSDWACGHEVAQCGRLIKGYGSTNERGKHHLLHVVRHISKAPFDSAQARAAALREVRLAALSDETGKTLDQASLRHGAPAREIPTQPIRWMRKPQFKGDH